MRFDRALIAVALTLCLAAPALADPFDDAVAAYDGGDYATAYRLLLPLADQGFVKAQVNLGLMYAYGRGVPQNDAEAAKWFQKAADQGDAFAEHNLGVMYDAGRGVTRDRVKAAAWFEKAANRGLADAQYDVGRMYAEGHGVRQDYVIAYMWLTLAAAQGDRRAMQNRGVLSQRMTRDQIAEAQKLAREWRPVAERR
jgi:TPR repeat protein